MSKQVVKVVGDDDTNTIEFHPANPASENLAGYLNDMLTWYQGEVSKAKVKKQGDVKAAGETERFERLAKSVPDRELSRYYQERARETRAATAAR